MSIIFLLQPVDKKRFEKYLNKEQEFEPDYDSSMDFGKTWEALVFVLTGGEGFLDKDKDSFNEMMFSGQHFDAEQDLGYGPAHFLSPEQVKFRNEKLKPVTEEMIKHNFNPGVMSANGIYPGEWADDDFNYLYENFKLLKKTFEEAAKNDEAIISYLS